MFWAKLFLVIVVVTQAKIFPPPLHQQYHEGSIELGSVCNLFLNSHSNIESSYYFRKIINRLNKNICQHELLFREQIHTRLNIVYQPTLKKQSYEIIVAQSSVQIRHSDYSGYVYALETLWQIIEDGSIPYCYIKDQPLVQHRGIMIDSSRHYLSTDSIKRLIESMPISKLNILHWHLVDDQSFPVILGSHPQLALYGSYSASQTYSMDSIREIIKFAAMNGVTIIPQINTPGHTKTWNLATGKDESLTIQCDGGYSCQMDVSKSAAVKLVQDVLHQIDSVFKTSPYIHLGGNNVTEACWKKRPSIATFMKLKNIHTYDELHQYWRFECKQALTLNRKVIYWANDTRNLTITKNDIAQYWGIQKNVTQGLGQAQHKIILSPSDVLLLSTGQGDAVQKDSRGQYSVWKDIIKKFNLFPQGIDRNRILGAQVIVDGFLTNQDTLQNNVWMRATAFAYRVWTDQKLQLFEIVEGLVKIQRTLNEMQVDASPFVSQYCENKAQKCFRGRQSKNQPEEALEM